MMRNIILLVCSVFFGACSLPAQIIPAVDECANPDSDWIFCENFDSRKPLKRKGGFGGTKGPAKVVDNQGIGGSSAWEATYHPGTVGAGDLQLFFGDTPKSMNNGIREGEHFREIYYRFYLRMSEGWSGVPDKMSRASVFAKDDWSQAMVAHLWGATSGRGLRLDPVNCSTKDYIRCSGYNNIGAFTWLKAKDGWAQIHAPEYNNRWICIETNVKLNTPGEPDGEQQLWVDDKFDTARTGLDFLASYKKHGINGIFLENYWNKGEAPATQKRWIDNFVVSTKRIGCRPTTPLAK